MKNELTSAQTMVELAKQGEEFKPLDCDHSVLGTFNTNETALEKGQRIHNEIEKQLEHYFNDPVTKSPMLHVQQLGRFRRRITQEINPKPQPNARELREMYGEIWHEGWVSMDTGVWPELARKIYEDQLWEC